MDIKPLVFEKIKRDQLKEGDLYITMTPNKLLLLTQLQIKVKPDWHGVFLCGSIGYLSRQMTPYFVGEYVYRLKIGEESPIDETFPDRIEL